MIYSFNRQSRLLSYQGSLPELKPTWAKGSFNKKKELMKNVHLCMRIRDSKWIMLFGLLPRDWRPRHGSAGGRRLGWAWSPSGSLNPEVPKGKRSPYPFRIGLTCLLGKQPSHFANFEKRDLWSPYYHKGKSINRECLWGLVWLWPFTPNLL